MNQKEKEYENLRREIEFCSTQKQTIFNMIVVSVTTILAWAISIKSPIICFLSYCIIFPLYNILLSYNIAIFKIQAYLCVFYQDDLWDTRLYKVNPIVNDNFNQQDSSYNYLFLFISIMSTVLSIIIVVELDCTSEYKNEVIITSLLLLLAFSIYIKKQQTHHEITTKYINAWEKVKNDETCSNESEHQIV